jgi:biotin-(acetyl-CoA carboxylase) ligase
VDLTTTLITLARHIHTTLLRNADAPFPTLLREYDHHHALIGRRVTVLSPTHPPITGKCGGLDHTGRLLIKDRRATHRIIAGHVEFI